MRFYAGNFAPHSSPCIFVVMKHALLLTSILILAAGITGCKKPAADPQDSGDSTGTVIMTNEDEAAEAEVVENFAAWFSADSLDEEGKAQLRHINEEMRETVLRFFADSVDIVSQGIIKSGEAYVLSFRVSDSLHYPGGYVWFITRVHAGTLDDLEMITTPEAFDLIDLLYQAEMLKQEVLTSTTGQRMLVGDDVALKLNPVEYPNIVSVVDHLSAFYSTSAIARIMDRYGIKENSGNVWLFADIKEEPYAWEEAAYIDGGQTASGAYALVEILTKDLERIDTIRAEYTVTGEGWKVEGWKKPGGPAM